MDNNTHANNMRKTSIDIKNEMVIFSDKEGDITIDVKLHEDTVWLTQSQIGLLLDTERSVITKHIRNIFKTNELDNSVCAKFAHTGADNKNYNVQYYNLDMIISVGYRVNSKRGIEFRRWANSILKEYLLKGYSINRDKIHVKQMQELQKTVELLSDTLIRENLVNEKGSEVIEIIKSYWHTWEILLQYDEERLEYSEDLEKYGDHDVTHELEIEKVRCAILSLKNELMQKGEASELFGQERTNTLDGILKSIYHTFGGKDLYPNLILKASHLLYFMIKNHPFSDGNKRIGCLIFLLFLKQNNFSSKLPDPAKLTSIALLVAQSDPSHKAIIIKLIARLLII